VTTDFVDLAKQTALSQGVADMSLVIFPHPMGMIPFDDIRKLTANGFAEIMRAATQWKPTAKLPEMQPAFPAEHFTLTGTAREISRMFYQQEWSMGLPIIPPTRERVAELLKGTSRRPDEVIGVVPPRMGVLTVEMAAVHAAMADCDPEFLPVIIAAMEALLAPETNWRGAGTTTGTTSILTIVNGPIVKQIGMAYGQGSAGKGHHVNAAIGYAINSITYVIGGSKPPAIDKGTLSAPSDFTGWIFGENEDALPKDWNPYHVDRGFNRNDSVVTVMATYEPVENIDHWSSNVTEQMKWWAHLISPLLNVGGPCAPMTLEQPVILALGPEHAEMMAVAGWTKAMFTQALWEQTQIPLSAWPKGCAPGLLERKLGKKLTPESMIPITARPDLMEIVIAGGAGKHSHYFAPFPGAVRVSRLIKS
jgi:hypothetical protein